MGRVARSAPALFRPLASSGAASGVALAGTSDHRDALRGLFRRTLAIGVALPAIRVALAISVPLYHTEAYYLQWSRFLDWGYVDHPPMIAWMIAALDGLIPGSVRLSARAASLVLGTATMLPIYRLALTMFGDRVTACRAVIVAACLPILTVLGFMIVPESPLLCFHLAALGFFAQAVRGGGSATWCAAGAAAGLALLSKLDALFPLIGAGGFLLSHAEHRPWLRRREPYLALLTALVVFVPYLAWNAEHDWTGLSLQLWRRYSHQWALHPRGPLEFVCEQLPNGLVLLVPMVACFMTPATALPPQQRAMFAILKWQSLSVFGGVFILATAAESHPNWTALAYPPAAVAMAAWWTARPTAWSSRLLRGAVPVMLVVLMLAAVVGVVGVQVVMRINPAAIGGSIGRGLAKARVRLLDWSDVRNEAERILARQFPAGDAELFCFESTQAALLSLAPEHRPAINLGAYLLESPGIENAQRYYLPRGAWRGEQGVLVHVGDFSVEGLHYLFEEVQELESIQPTDLTDIRPTVHVFRVAKLRH
jgi:hypothetical protein